MTNWEKYSNMFNTTEFGLINGKPVLCDDIRCDDCEWSNENADCSPNQMNWLKSEYNDTREKIHQAKVDLLNTLSWNILCDKFSFCTECPLYLLKGHNFDDATCNTVLRAVLLEGVKEVFEND